MEPTSLIGVFVGYEMMSGYLWSGIYVVWTLNEFVHTDLSTKDSGLSRRQRMLHKVKALELPDEGFFPLKPEYDTVNHSLDGVRASRLPSALELPSAEDG
ncbi:MAG: hypothetical protein ACKPKO_39840, partial [Candidatus Fonsibacter sp.]